MDDATLMTTAQVKNLLGGWCDMTIWRFLNLPAYQHFGFPRPIKINHRNYFRRQEIVGFIDRLEVKQVRGAAGQVAEDGCGFTINMDLGNPH